MAEEDKDLQDLLDSALDGFRDVASQGPARTSDDAQSSVEVAQRAGKGVSDREVSTSSRSAAGQSNIAESADSTSGAAAGTSTESHPGLGLGLPSLAPPKKGKKAVKKSGVGGGLNQGAGSSQSSGSRGGTAPDLDANLGRALEQLAEQTRQTVEGMDPGGAGLDDEMVNKLMGQFEQLGGADDMQGVMDTMMKQLLSKDVLYGPLVEIGERYPGWLETNRSRLSEADFQRFSQQHKCILELCHAYETSPENFELIVNLMQKMQECGQPPDDIVKELAPGMEFGDDGLPMLPDMGGGASGAQGQPNCSIM